MICPFGSPSGACETRGLLDRSVCFQTSESHLSAREWMDKQFFLTKSEMELPHGVVLGAENMSVREKILALVWTSYVTDEFQLDPDKRTLMDRIGGWIEEGRIFGRSQIGRSLQCIESHGRIQEPEQELCCGSHQLGLCKNSAQP